MSNFHPLEVVGRGSDTQLQVGENLNQITGPVISYKLRYIEGFWLVEMVISINQKPTIYRSLYENTAAGKLPDVFMYE